VKSTFKKVIIFTGIILSGSGLATAEKQQIRARELGLSPGILPAGEYNAITDVSGVRVGHFTLNRGNAIHTGATAILPHGGNVYQDKVPAAMVIGNGFGKMTGFSQVEELGEIETPILLTNTLNVPNAAHALVEWTLRQKGNEKVWTINPIVGETNDARLNDIRGLHLTPKMMTEAIDSARPGPVAEGSVGAGTGTVAFGWKGGIGTSSRVLPGKFGGYTVGVLVQSNYGGVLQIAGVPVGESLDQYYLKDDINNDDADGSIMIVVATDAPLSDRNLKRLGKRAMAGLARTGSSLSNGSGDYVISFSTAEEVRRTPQRRKKISTLPHLPNDLVSPLFQATIEATEEAIYNSLFMATSTTGLNPYNGEPYEVRQVPVDRVKELLQRFGRIQ
jgi:D-aminopeptidase